MIINKALANRLFPRERALGKRVPQRQDGTLFGVAAALTVSRLFNAVLYGISPKDPLTYVLAITLMIVVTLLACTIPARRALALDPASALRED